MPSIGTYNEKTLHAELKKQLCPDEACHEIRIGRFVADLFENGRVTEIQTRSFFRMKHKLAAFLADEERIPNGVRIVYPAVRKKRIFWVSDSGEVTGGRLSPKSWGEQDILRELYSLRPLLLHPRLTIEIVMTDVEEYRRLDGWSADGKKGSNRIDRIPKAFGETIPLSSPSDYLALLPPKLPERFTRTEYTRASRFTRKSAAYAFAVLTAVGALLPDGKEGRKVYYRRTASE
ncbi:MAG: hypothetical protein E7655_05640 [Ruminococcaceae bacterium]|nr:hypothetical protein [Oscillospiraceae bacterium]